MEIFKLIIELVGVVAWPLVVLVLLLNYRESIAGLMRRLTSLQIGDNSLSLGPGLEDAEETTDRALVAVEQKIAPEGIESGAKVGEPTITTNLPSDSAERSDKNEAGTAVITAKQLAEYYELGLYMSRDPGGLVVTSWIKIEQALNRLYAATTGAKLSQRPMPLAEILHKLRGVLPGESFEAISKMRNLRNRVAHGDASVGLAEALAYAENAETIVRMLGALQFNEAR